MQAAAEAARLQRLSSDLREYSQGQHESAAQALSEVGGSAVAASLEFLPTPVSEAFQTVEFMPQTQELAEKLVAQASGSRGCATWSQRVEADWREKHSTLTNAGRAAILAPTAVRTECQRAGMCICGDRGFKQFVARLSSLLKNACPRGSPRRHDLNSGALVLCLTAHGSGGETTEHFWHLSFVSWSPYLFAAQELQETSRDGRCIELQARFVQRLSCVVMCACARFSGCTKNGWCGARGVNHRGETGLRLVSARPGCPISDL